MNSVFSKAAGAAMVSVASLALGCEAATAAGAQTYVSVFGGGSFPSEIDIPSDLNLKLQLDSAYTLGGAFGRKWNEHLRTELELSHADWPATHWANNYASGKLNGDLSATYFLGNIWFDMPNRTAITPYAGGGLGIGLPAANAKTDFGQKMMDGTSGFAFQAGVGVRIALNNRLDLDVGYRLKDLRNVNFTYSSGYQSGRTDLVSHNFQAGLTVKF